MSTRGRSPDIVLVMADQLAASALPAYGNQVVDAPNLTALAEQGVVFESAYCPSPLCTPSRMAMLTGLLPSRCGAYDNGAELSSGIPTFAHHLRLAGYQTSLAGKLHFVGADQLHGFEERLTTDVYPAGLDWTPDWRLAPYERLPWYHEMTSVLEARPVAATLQLDYDEEVAFQAVRKVYDLARGDDRRPFLLAVSFTHPHDPFQITPAYWDRYDDADVDEPAVGPLPAGALDAHSRRLRAMCDAGRREIGAEHVRAARHGYYAAISYVDDKVGELLGALAATGLDEDAVVILTSDHGEMLGERGLWYKMSFFEGSARVPLVVHAPARFAPRRVAGTVSLLDLAPTLAELAGTPRRELGDLDGESLVPLCEGRVDGWRDGADAEYLAEGVTAPAVMLRRGRYKLVHCPGDPDLLYDLADDPHELADLAGDPAHAGALAQLRAELDERWDLDALAAAVRESQCRRHLVARALRTGRASPWEYEPPARTAERYVGAGRDFWTTLRRSTLPLRDGATPRALSSPTAKEAPS